MTKPRANPAPGEYTLNPDSLREMNDPLYCPPSWQDIRAVKFRFNLTGTAISNIIGISTRMVRNYLSEPETVAKTSHYQMQYAQWRMLLIATKIVPPPTIDISQTRGNIPCK